MRKTLLTLAAASLVAGTTVAQAATVAPRTGATLENAEGLKGRGGTILPIILALAVIIGIIVITDDDDEEDLPFSP